ncbi:MAG: DHA2 family efflux MFS transporter permease subunit [Gammaproteobacteria bacterium]
MGSNFPPITGVRLVLLTVGVSLGLFMNVLDTSIANVAIPTIAGNLAVSPDEGTWVITSFAVSLAIALPLTGWLGKRFGQVRLFLAATLLFSLLSLLCGLATSLPMLILCRVLQGAVAGPMIPLSQSLLQMNYPPEKQGTALSIWGMIAVVAPVVGPVLGGVVTDDFSWPWVFYINVPIGLVAVAITAFILRGRETEKERRPMDKIGLGLLIVGVASLQIMLDKGNELAWFSSSTICWLAAIAVVALSFFVAWELTERNPVVDLTLFGRRNFTVATLAISLGYLTFFGSIIIFPLWLQTEMGYTATWAGIAAAPVGLLAVFVAPMVGGLMRRFDPRLLVTIAFALFAGVSFWISRFATNVDLAQLMVPRLVFGIGIPLFFIPLIAMSVSGLPPERIASASGLFNFMRMLAGGFGASISVAIWDQRQALHDARLSEVATVHNPFTNEVFNKLGELGMSAKASLADLAHVISQQSFMLATNDFFWLSGWVFLALLGLVWFAKRSGGGSAPAGAGE